MQNADIGGEKEMSEHEHEHDHDHGHDHHHHDHGPMENKEQVTALLDYMYKHNRSHEDELVKMAEKLKSLGHEAESAKVSEAQSFFAKGNELLSEALAQLKS